MEYEGADYIYFADEPDTFYPTTNFFYARALADSAQNYTFYYEDASVTRADVVFHLYVSGGPRNYDRPFTLEQIQEQGKTNAVPGTNYVAFDSEEMKREFVLKAGEVHLEMPVTVLRTADLEEYALRFRLAENEHFKPGQEDLAWRKVLFTSALQRPTQWNTRYDGMYFGKYSRTKHSWMIEETGERWDNEFVDMLLVQTDVRTYWLGRLKRRLYEINAERAQQGLGPWEDEDGDEIMLGSNA